MDYTMNKRLILDHIESLGSRKDIIDKVKFINNWTIKRPILDRFNQEFNLNKNELEEVVEAYRQYFLMNLIKPPQIIVGMPSFIVDELWHTHLLYTKNYMVFCHKALGQFLHHLPNSASPKAQAAIKEATESAFILNSYIDFGEIRSQELPLLFVIDSILFHSPVKQYQIGDFDHIIK